MQKNGWNNFLLCCFLIPLLLVVMWLFGAVPSHTITMVQLENTFSNLKHPPDSTQLQYSTYFGVAPTAGNTSDACYYYVAGVFRSSETFNTISEYYKDQSPKLLAKFSASELVVVPISDEQLNIMSNLFLSQVVEVFLEANHNDAYILYLKKTDQNNFGDFRCWMI